jgi:hypothetical protein
MLSAIGRTLIAFVLGALVGTAGTAWLFYSGAGDFLLRPGPVVRDLERRLDEVEAQRDQLGRSLEDVVRRAEESEARFRRLETRLQSMISAAERAEQRPEATGQGAEPAPSPSGAGQTEGE